MFLGSRGRQINCHLWADCLTIWDPRYPVARIVFFSSYINIILEFVSKKERNIFMFPDVVNVAGMALSIYWLVIALSGRGIGYRFSTGTWLFFFFVFNAIHYGSRNHANSYLSDAARPFASDNLVAFWTRWDDHPDLMSKLRTHGAILTFPHTWLQRVG
jgi:hypothetical protein